MLLDFDFDVLHNLAVEISVAVVAEMLRIVVESVVVVYVVVHVVDEKAVDSVVGGKGWEFAFAVAAVVDDAFV